MIELARVAELRLGPLKIGNRNALVLVAGPARLESAKMALEVGRELRDICRSLRMRLAFRSAIDPGGVDSDLEILAQVRAEIEVPVVALLDEAGHAERVAAGVDGLQLAETLARRGGAAAACAATGRPCIVQKEAVESPWETVARLDPEGGRGGIMVAEGGTAFGYGNRVVDFRSCAVLRAAGLPVLLDLSRAVALPGTGGEGGEGGRREFSRHLARAATAVGIDALGCDVHPDPANATCGRETQIPLAEVKELLLEVLAVDRAVRAGATYR